MRHGDKSKEIRLVDLTSIHKIKPGFDHSLIIKNYNI